VKPVILLGCYRCIFHGTGSSAQHCQNYGIQYTVRCNLKLQDEDIQFSDGTSVEQTNKKFFELTPVEFEVKDSFTGYDTSVHLESSDDRRYTSLISERLLVNLY
jgi:hypothetical protein